MKPRATIPELEGKLVVRHSTAAKVLDLGETAYFKNLHDGSLPLRVKRVGKSEKVLVSSIYEVLGI